MNSTSITFDEVSSGENMYGESHKLTYDYNISIILKNF